MIIQEKYIYIYVFLELKDLGHACEGLIVKLLVILWRIIARVVACMEIHRRFENLLPK